MSKAAIRIILFATFFLIAYAFYALAEKKKGTESEKVFKGLGRFFEALPWLIVAIGAVILVIALIFILFE